MADFSFSFDSDNPFAEPETAPKPAPAAGDDKTADRPASDAANSSDVEAAGDDEFSFDSLDFALDEGASADDNLPTRPDAPNAPRQPTPGEAAFAEFDFGSSENSASEVAVVDDVIVDEAVVDETPDFDLGAEDELAVAEVAPEFEEDESSTSSNFAANSAAVPDFEDDEPIAAPNFVAVPDFEEATSDAESAPETGSSSDVNALFEEAEAPSIATSANLQGEPEAMFTEADSAEVTPATESRSAVESDLFSEADPLFEGANSASEIELSPETEVVAPNATISESGPSTKKPGKQAMTDLDEFNALIFGADSFTDSAATQSESEPGEATNETALSDEQTSDVASAMKFDLASPTNDSTEDSAAEAVAAKIEDDGADIANVETAPTEITAVEEPAFAAAEVEDADVITEGLAVAEESEVVSADADAETIGNAEIFGEAEVLQSEPMGGEISVPDAVAAAGEIATESPIEEELGVIDVSRRAARVMPVVAILGASGIGKNHARWFHRNGCRVAAFLGTSGDSIAQTEADLSAEFPFEGTAYTDLGELLENERPDIVCVATPSALHFGQVLQCLEAGAHVLCEKPLVYAPTRKFRENRDGAKELVKVAAKKKLTLGTQLQYGAATPILCKLAGLSPTDVGDFAMELETTNPNSPADPHELWIDLGPHPVSVAQMLAGADATLAEETIRFEPEQTDDKTEVVARFGINCADGRLLMVRAVVRSLRGTNRKPRRRFSFNGHSVVYAPLQTAKGGFQAQFVAPDGYASVYADPVDYLIGDFVRACRDERAPLISGDFGRENLEWMLKVAGAS